MFTEVDFSKTYRIEPVPSKIHGELKEKGISTYPGTTVSVTPSYDYTLSKYKNTGLDENDPVILKMDADAKKVAREWIKQTREWLEASIGNPGFLAPTSDGWASVLSTVLIETGQDLQIRVNGHINTLNPSTNHKDAIALLLLMNDPDFPKSKKDLSDSKYRGAKFYITTDEEIDNSTKAYKNKVTKAHVEFSKLFEEGSNKKRAWEIAYFMRLVNKQKGNTEKLEMDMYNAIFQDKTQETMGKFIEAVEMDNATLILYNMLNQAVSLGVIKVGKDNIYYRGTSNYRDSIEGSVNYLKMPDMATELAGLKEAVSKQLKKFENV